MLIAILADVIKDWKKDDLLRGLDELGVPAGPVNTLPEVFATDQVAARDMKITMEHPVAGSGHVDLIGNPLKLNQTPIDYRRPPPMLGQHTAEVLEELLGPDAVQKAKTNKIIE